MKLKVYADRMSQPSRAILIFCKYSEDASRKAKIPSVLDWHHLNLHRGAAGYVLNTVLAPLLGLPLNAQAAAEAEKVLVSSLSTIENIWLKGDEPFLLGSFQPSIADLSLVCEIMQLQLFDEKDHDRIIGPYKKVQRGLRAQKMQRSHILMKFIMSSINSNKLKARLSVQQSSKADGQIKSGIKAPIISPINHGRNIHM